jgi:ribonuclease P protein component
MKSIWVLSSNLRFTFRRKNRLTNAAAYEAVFSTGKRFSEGHLQVIVRVNSLAYARLGLRVSKKNAKRAVDRHTIQRLIRETFRQNQHPLAGKDVVVIARRGIMNWNRTQLYQALKSLWQKIS